MLVRILTARADNLEKMNVRYIIDYNLQKIAENIRWLILKINEGLVVTRDISEISTFNDEDIHTMLARMAWYLLHPEVVPNDIRTSWEVVLHKLKYVNVNEIIQAISDLKKERITEFGTSSKLTPNVTDRIVQLLQVLEGMAYANDKSRNSDANYMNSVEKAAKKAAENAEKKAAEKTLEKPEEKADEKPEEKAAEKALEKPEEKTDEKPEEKTDEKAEKKPITEFLTKPSDIPTDFKGRKPLGNQSNANFGIDMQPLPDIREGMHSDYKINDDYFRGGAIQMPSSFFQMAMGPVIEHIKHIYPVYSAIESISPSLRHDLIAPLQRLLRICSTISHEKHYGFYRISNVPLELFNYIHECITNIVDYQLYEEIPHETRAAYQYFLCLKGNISFTTVPNKTVKQRAECKAVRTYFKQNTLYLLYTTKKKLTMESYLDDPFYVYDIKYDSINDEQNVMKIKEVDSILNENSIELSRYLTAKPTGIFDEKQLELSVFHQLNRLTIL